MIEHCYSLRRAAKVLGVARGTLKVWLAQEGLVMPELARGARAMIRERDLERLIRKRSPQSNFAVLRKAAS